MKRILALVIVTMFSLTSVSFAAPTVKPVQGQVSTTKAKKVVKAKKAKAVKPVVKVVAPIAK